MIRKYLFDFKEFLIIKNIKNLKVLKYHLLKILLPFSYNQNSTTILSCNIQIAPINKYQKYLYGSNMIKNEV